MKAHMPTVHIVQPNRHAVRAAALQEQAEREKGCEYCDPCTADEEWRKNWTIEGKNSHDGGDVMSVNFCPICGRPLK